MRRYHPGHFAVSELRPAEISAVRPRRQRATWRSRSVLMLRLRLPHADLAVRS